MRSCCVVLVAALVLLGSFRTASAQEADGLAAVSEPPHEVVAAQRNVMDVGDLWRSLRRQAIDPTPTQKRSLVAAPSIGSKPSTGLSVGFSSSMAFFAGEPAHTHISTMLAGIKVTQNKQVNFGNRLALFTKNDRWFLQLDNRFAWTSQNTYAFGTDSPITTGTNAKYNSIKLSENVYRQIQRRLFIGGGLTVSDYSDIRAGRSGGTPWDNSQFIAYSRAAGLSETDQNSSGANFGLRLDTRDSSINADHGWLAAGTYRAFFKGFLGGDTDWGETSIDVRTYKPLTQDGRHKVAFWLMGDFIAHGVAPFFDLPAIAADGRSARGYAEGRYRGDKLLYSEMEYRSTLTANGLLGFVVFANATTVGNSFGGTSLFDSIAPAGGAGLRVLLNKHTRTNLCTDYGWGKDGSRGFYLSIQEAF
jgi:outer membrane protein assembly factor BamA